MSREFFIPTNFTSSSYWSAHKVLTKHFHTCISCFRFIWGLVVIFYLLLLISSGTFFGVFLFLFPWSTWLSGPLRKISYTSVAGNIPRAVTGRCVLCP